MIFIVQQMSMNIINSDPQLSLFFLLPNFITARVYLYIPVVNLHCKLSILLLCLTFDTMMLKP